MDVDKFSNYLLAILLTLQLIGYVIFFLLWIRFGFHGVLLAIALVFILDTMILYYLQRVKITDDKGLKKNLESVIGDVIAIAVWLGISSVFFTIITMVIGYDLAIKYNMTKEMGLFVPVLAVGTMYGSLAFVSKVCNKN